MKSGAVSNDHPEIEVVQNLAVNFVNFVGEDVPCAARFDRLSF